jgi:thiosulfate/3-mercaptopyruvate sulfurtransferase
MGRHRVDVSKFTAALGKQRMIGNTLISAEVLNAQLHSNPNLRIVDARFVLTAPSASTNSINPGFMAWQTSHLPNAAYFHLDQDLSDKRKSAEHGRHPMPDAADFCQVLQRCGISKDTEVVIYDAADGAMAAARAWWLMRLLGHRHVAVLDGGFARWQQLGFLVDDATPVFAQSVYQAEYDHAQIVAVEALENKNPQMCLIDARAAERFRAEHEPIDHKAGHIPGAINRAFNLNLENGRFQSPDALRAAFQNLIGDKKVSDTILYCGSGVAACHHLLAMEVAGLSGARIFPPSWSGWISDENHPIEIGAS